VPNKKNQSLGFSLLEVMIGVGILSILTSAMFSIFVDSQFALRRTREKDFVQDLRSRIIQEINRQDSWIETYRRNSNFSCLLQRPPTCTDVASEFPFILYNRIGGVAHDAVSSSTSGFTWDGRACNTALDNACPYRLELTWRLLSTANLGNTSFPTGYFPYGYHVSTYFSPPSFPSGFAPYAGYGYLGTLPGQIRVTGRFLVHTPTGSAAVKSRAKVWGDKYGFQVYKEVP
jgi:prepilin-type N-terminal cleavage/methylation domain-containing protein